jgi:hypothetical protein
MAPRANVFFVPAKDEAGNLPLFMEQAAAAFAGSPIRYAGRSSAPSRGQDHRSGVALLEKYVPPTDGGRLLDDLGLVRAIDAARPEEAR